MMAERKAASTGFAPLASGALSSVLERTLLVAFCLLGGLSSGVASLHSPLFGTAGRIELPTIFRGEDRCKILQTTTPRAGIASASYPKVCQHTLIPTSIETHIPYINRAQCPSGSLRPYMLCGCPPFRTVGGLSDFSNYRSGCRKPNYVI